MKKRLLLSLCAAIILSFYSCTQTTENNSSANTSSGIVSIDEEGSEYENEDKLKIKELENRLSTIQLRLSEIFESNRKLSSTNQELTDKFSDASKETNKIKEKLDKLQPPSKVISSFYYQNAQIHLELSENINTHKKVLTINFYADFSKDVISDYNITYYQISPDGTKIVFDDVDYEQHTASIYLYDVAKREAVKLSNLTLPENTTPAYLQWLDDRYFMFILRLDEDDVVRSGDVYVYDTEAEKCQQIIKTSQTCTLNVYSNSFVVITSTNDIKNSAKPEYHIITAKEIYSLINSNETVDLSKKEA